MPIHKTKLIAAVAVVIFIVGVVAAGRYAALAPRVDDVRVAPPSAAQPAQRNSMAAMPATGGGKIDSVEVMLERLRARLETEPNDVDGWVLLGRSYHYLERWDDAKAAFAKARALGYRGDAGTGTDADGGAAMSGGAMPHAAAGGDAIFNEIGRVGSGAAAATDATPP